jgi:hypothetical protein
MDIETEPREDLIDVLPEPEVKTGNLKDPDKIQAKMEEARAAQIERMALDPDYGRVIAISTAYRNYEGEILADCSIRATPADPADLDVDRAEAVLINDFCEFLQMHGAGRPIELVTYNGATFDIPFLLRRIMHLIRFRDDVGALRFPVTDCVPYHCNTIGGKHCDVFQVLKAWSPNPLNLPMNLTAVCKRLLPDFPPPAEHDQKLAYASWFKEGEFGKLQDMAMWDAEATLRLRFLLGAVYP